MSASEKLLAAFDKLAAVFNDSAVWQPSDGGQPYQAAVLFDAPTKGIEFDAPGVGGIDLTLEQTDFVLVSNAVSLPGLKEAVDDGKTERLDITKAGKHIGSFYVRSVRFVGDGRQIEARLSNEVPSNDSANTGNTPGAITRLLAGGH